MLFGPDFGSGSACSAYLACQRLLDLLSGSRLRGPCGYVLGIRSLGYTGSGHDSVLDHAGVPTVWKPDRTVRNWHAAPGSSFPGDVTKNLGTSWRGQDGRLFG